MKYSWRKKFTPLRVLNLFIKSFVSHFVDIALTFLIVHLTHFIWYNIFSTKLAISLFLGKFASFGLAVIFSDVTLLNSWDVIYLSSSWSTEILFSISIIFVL